jgi:hypothetical protein
MVICDNLFGFTPTAPLDCLKIHPGSNNVVITDEHLNLHEFSPSKYKITPAYEGVIVRAFKHKGIVYFSTHKKLNCDRSRWGLSDYFLDIYKKLNGPSPKHLFPEEVMTSPWCYVFILVDPKLLVATQQDVGCGYIVHLSTEKMWDYEDKTCPYAKEDVRHIAPAILSYSDKPLKFSGEETPLLIRPKYLSLDQANEFLRVGYSSKDLIDTSSPIKWCQGEAIVIFQNSGDGKIDSVRVQSPGFHCRLKFRGDNSNIHHRFYQLLSDAIHNPFTKDRRIDQKKIEDFLQKYPFHKRLSNTAVSVYHCGQFIRLDLLKRDNRIFLVYVSYLQTLPPNLKQEGLEMWEEFKKNRDDVTAWIQSIAIKKFRGSKLEDIPPLSDRMRDILRLTINYAHQRVASKRDKNRKGQRMSEEQLIKANIHNLIQREYGPSLYKLIKEMNMAEKED